MEKRIVQKVIRFFTEEEKHKIINDLISTGCTKTEVWKKYTGEEQEHGQILRWMKELGYDSGVLARSPNIVSNLYPMAKKKIKHDKSVKTEGDSFENMQLKRRIAELEKQLKDAELKAIAFSTMVDIAEREFNIPIRKSSIPNHRSNEKQLFTHRISQVMWMVWDHQTGLLSKQLGRHFNHPGRRFDNTTGKGNS
ncbi:MAG: hypothetical protein IPO49_13950 [Bacteroidetes bacterium]|nr:hypothetical protein [Bacteroidota bacterium]